VSLSLGEIRRRRGELLERARAERMEVRALFESQRNFFWFVDRGVEMVRFLLPRKGLLLVSAIAFAVVQPRRALRWAARAWGLFRLIRKISRALA
jgi:hypothetical protein